MEENEGERMRKVKNRRDAVPEGQRLSSRDILIFLWLKFFIKLRSNFWNWANNIISKQSFKFVSLSAQSPHKCNAIFEQLYEYLYKYSSSAFETFVCELPNDFLFANFFCSQVKVKSSPGYQAAESVEQTHGKWHVCDTYTICDMPYARTIFTHAITLALRYFAGNFDRKKWRRQRENKKGRYMRLGYVL